MKEEEMPFAACKREHASIKRELIHDIATFQKTLPGTLIVVCKCKPKEDAKTVNAANQPFLSFAKGHHLFLQKLVVPQLPKPERRPTIKINTYKDVGVHLLEAFYVEKAKENPQHTLDVVTYKETAGYCCLFSLPRKANITQFNAMGDAVQADIASWLRRQLRTLIDHHNTKRSTYTMAKKIYFGKPDMR